MLKNRSFTPRFRTEAFTSTQEQRPSQEAAAKRTAIHDSTQANWIAGTGITVVRPVRPGAWTVSNWKWKTAGCARSGGGSAWSATSVFWADRVLCQGVAARYAFMKQWRHQYPVDVMAHV